MFAIELFVLFLFVYAWLLTPDRDRHITPIAAVAPEPIPAIAEPATPAIELPEQPATTLAELEPVAVTPIVPDYSTVERGELRKLCQAAGIRWRSAHGKNKHLTAAEMRQRLTELATATAA